VRFEWQAVSPPLAWTLKNEPMAAAESLRAYLGDGAARRPSLIRLGLPARVCIPMAESRDSHENEP